MSTAGLTLQQEKYSGFWEPPGECDTLVLCNRRLGHLDLVSPSSTDLGSKEKTPGPLIAHWFHLGTRRAEMLFPQVHFLLKYVSAAEKLGL